VYQSSHVYQDCTNSVRIVKNNQKTVKSAKMALVYQSFTCLPSLYQQCSNSVPIVKNCQKTVKTAKIIIGVPIVTCLPRLYQSCTNSVPKTVKRQSKQQNDHWCTNRHMSTQSPPNTQSPRPRPRPPSASASASAVRLKIRRKNYSAEFRGIRGLQMPHVNPCIMFSVHIDTPDDRQTHLIA